MKKHLIAICSFLATTAFGQVATTDAGLVSGNATWRYSNETVSASNQVKVLTEKRQPSIAELEIADDAKDLFKDKSSILALMVLHKGEIISEQYRWPSSASTPMFSWSMSKSLTSYTIGQSLCQRNIKSLDDTAEKYYPRIAGSAYGETTIKNLLTMSSGTRPPPNDFVGSSQRPGQWEELAKNRNTLENVVTEFPNREVPQGTRFAYNNSDTLALSLVLEGTGGFIKQFDSLFWKKAKTESKGHWIVDRKGVPVAAAGFSATTKDWARMATYIVDVHNKRADSNCFQEYVKQADSIQVTGIYQNRKANYGYQVWVKPSNSFWWAGFGGQKVGIDPDKELILVVFASRNDSQEEIAKLFSKWQDKL